MSTQRVKEVYIRSYGCSMNLAQSEFIAGCLRNYGYNITNSIKEADIIIFNTCAVKKPTEDKIISAIKAVPEDKKIIVTGCLTMVNLNRILSEARVNGVIGPFPGSAIIDIVKEVEKNNKLTILRNDFKPPLTTPRIPTSSIIRVIPIAYGCLGECTYCCEKIAAGYLRSYSIKEITEAVKEAISKGVLEIWLSSHDCGCYGYDIGVNLGKLLREIIGISREFYVRIGMMSPDTALKIVNELIEAYRSGKVFRFIHIPVQSGDDHVLKLMKRKYTVDDFKNLINKLRENIPDITIVTDIICGFPGETDNAFENSIKLIREVEPDFVNVSKFGPRPGTPAAKMRKLPTRIVKERSRIMSRLATDIAIRRNMKWIGWIGNIIVDEEGRNGTVMGRNYAYKPIVVSGGRELIGKIVKVKIIDVASTHLKGVLVN
ncbi:MAG: tRNA (N(6)-L-threonylcarbamoyladenosine(37)-C(2))-methylthiotransferase [Candidatus Methanomethylicia archaeon]